MKKEKITGLDFETGIDANMDCQLQYVALSNEKYEEVYELKDIKEITRFLVAIVSSGETYVVYNASFDIEIIITLLLEAGFTFIEDADQKRDKTMILTAGAKIYKLETYIKENNKWVKSEFVDLGNLIVGSNLKEIAENYTDLHKGDYDKAKENEKEFKEYNLLDARITRKAYCRIMEELGGDYITIGAAAFDLMLKENFKGSKSERREEFYKVYGKLSVKDDRFIRNWYRGGFGWCSVDYRWTGRINSYDKKSAYPYECIGKDYPTWIGHRVEEGYKEPNKDFPFAFYKIEITGQVKVNHCPVLPSRNIYGDSNKYIYDGETIYIIRIYGEKSEWDWFMENMEIDNIRYIETILMCKASMNPLEKYMIKYYNIKETSEGVRKDTAKRLINALTGKLGSNSIQHNMTFKLEDGVLKRDEYEEVEAITFATQVVSVITSRVRCELYEIDSKLRDKCEFRLYCTDSCKHSLETTAIKEGKGKIGEWKLEKENVDFIYLGLKAYMFDPYNEKGIREVVCAGISKNYKSKITPEEFYNGNLVETLTSVRKRNGRIIFEDMKKISTSIKKERRRK